MPLIKSSMGWLLLCHFPDKRDGREMVMTNAFQRAWLELLQHERVTVTNIEGL
jgi:hypothetical protein